MGLLEPFADHRHGIELCSFCPKMCRHACPVAEAERTETAIPEAKVAVARMVMDGMVPLTEEVAATAYKCTSCLLSREFCKHANDVPVILQRLRAEAIQRGVAPERVRTFLDRFASAGNPYEAGLEEVVRSAVPAQWREGGRPVRLLADCVTLRHFPGHLTDLCEILRAIGDRDVSVIAFEKGCCGYPLYAMGDREAFRERARSVAKEIQSASKIVCPSPGCAHTVKNLYPSVGVPVAPEVVHTSTWLQTRRADLLPHLEPDADETLSFHDSCHLTRYLGETQAPRALLDAVSRKPVREMAYHGKTVDCSGGGGGYAKVFPAGAAEIARRRIEEFEMTGADRLVTACPSCRRQFEKAAGPGRFVDIVSLIAERLRP